MEAAGVGSVFLWAAVAALVGAAAWSIARPGHPAGHRLLAVGATSAWVATLALLRALVVGDFSLAYVADTTTRDTTWPFRVSALWGGMEGSLLLWAAMSAALLALASRSVRRDTPELLRGFVTVGSLIAAALLVVDATVADPFARLQIPAIDGAGLAAILRHPAMTYHPPILYLGLTSLTVPFATTLAALQARQVDRPWLALTRRWMWVSWTALTFGMVAGANWAYVELGWGGFWAWDAVENTSLLPWLAATAFLHSSLAHRVDGRLAGWNAAMATLPFVLTTLGMYITRSGVTPSVHAFAESPTVGRMLLWLLAASALAAGWALVRRAPTTGGWRVRSGSVRERHLMVNNVFLGWAIVVVAVGTSYPAASRAVGGEATLVAPRFFIAMLAPVTVVALVAMGSAFRTRGSVGVAGIAAGTAVALAVVLGVRSPLVLAYFAAGTATAGSSIVALARGGRRSLVGGVAHVGLAMVMLGSAGSALGADARAPLTAGDTLELGPYVVRLVAVEVGERADHAFVQARVEIERDGRLVDEVRPELRAYEGRPLPTPEPALRSTPLDDVVVGIARISDDATVIDLTASRRPMVFWVWWGGLAVAAAGAYAWFAAAGSGAPPRRLATAGPPPADTTTGSASGSSPARALRSRMPGRG